MREPIRILQVFAQMNRGGAETMIMNLYRNIDRSKVQFDFMVNTEEECAFDEEIEKLGGKIFRIQRYTGKNHFQYKKDWANFIENHPEHKIIHGHVRSTASIYLKQAKLNNRIAIAHSHNTSSGKGIQAVVKNILQYQIRLIADYMFACSEGAGKWLFGKKAIESDKFLILKNAIEIEKFKFDENTRIRVRNNLNIDGKYVVGHVGRFHPQKNHEFIIEIFNSLKKVKNNAVLLLIGDGEEKKKIEDKVEKLNLSDSVFFLDVRDDVNELFQAMDVFLFPSKYEGLGIVVVEAQATGLPCVISDTIPSEAYICDTIQVESLYSNVDKWTNDILKCTLYKSRLNMTRNVKACGYDVKDTAKLLEEFYTSYENIR